MRETKKLKSIRAKIILLALTVAIVPLIMSNLMNTILLTKDVGREVNETLQERTSNIGIQISEYINRGYGVVETLSYTQDIKSMDSIQQKELL